MSRKADIENRFFDHKMETLPQDQIKILQVERLRKSIERMMRVPFFKEKFEAMKITPDSIQTVDDIRRLPFTTKNDFREHYPLGLLSVPKSEVIRFHGSSGTTGKPTFVAYNREDLDIWSGLVARFLVSGGLTPDQTCQISFGYGLFTGGFGLHYGIEKVGASIIPVAAGNTARQIMMLTDMEPETIIATPSYLLNIAEEVVAAGIDPKSLKLRFAHLGGEPWTEDIRTSIESQLPIYCFDNYGLSEVGGPGVSGECYMRDGMHFQEDCFIVECLNPDTLEPVPEGEVGELVITPLMRMAMPVCRYRTRDLARIMPGTCPCGRTGRRMTKLRGRSDDMLIIRGVNVFPTQIEIAMLSVPGTSPHYQIEVSRPGALDQIKLKVELMPEAFSDSMSVMQQFREQIAHAIYSSTGLHIQVELLAPKTLERFLGKAKRVIDTRKLQS
ncbi:MAG: phenylacetate--CoA ligase [Thermoguttaceae bacterium]|nr:phenylacetate--CoA ligase [Thermoguttaceae bacterium]